MADIIDLVIGRDKMAYERAKADNILVIKKHEGGHNNDLNDLGGETNFGISKRSYPSLNISKLTKKEAISIYKKDYWDKNRVEELPKELRHIFFDMCVNQGRGTAVKVLQRSANGKGANIGVDGGLGPATLKAIQNVEIERVRCYRVKHRFDLVNKKPEQARFLFGWYRRALEV